MDDWSVVGYGIQIVKQIHLPQSSIFLSSINSATKKGNIQMISATHDNTFPSNFFLLILIRLIIEITIAGITRSNPKVYMPLEFPNSVPRKRSKSVIHNKDSTKDTTASLFFIHFYLIDEFINMATSFFVRYPNI